MRKDDLFSGIRGGIILSIITLIIAIILSIIACFIPGIYNFIRGDYVINSFIDNITINTSDPDDLSIYLLSWINKNIHYPTKEEIVVNSLIYKIDNKYRIWIRSDYASWFLLSKLGRCGEDASFYVEIMDRTNHMARKIKATNWDHSWAEYYSDNHWIAIDPSANKIITNRIIHAKGKNATKILGEYPNGTEIDLSELYGIYNQSYE